MSNFNYRQEVTVVMNKPGNPYGPSVEKTILLCDTLAELKEERGRIARRVDNELRRCKGAKASIDNGPIQELR